LRDPGFSRGALRIVYALAQKNSEKNLLDEILYISSMAQDPLSDSPYQLAVTMVENGKTIFASQLRTLNQARIVIGMRARTFAFLGGIGGVRHAVYELRENHIPDQTGLARETLRPWDRLMRGA
jgi:hypothetical protein